MNGELSKLKIINSIYTTIDKIIDIRYTLMNVSKKQCEFKPKTIANPFYNRW